MKPRLHRVTSLHAPTPRPFTWHYLHRISRLCVHWNGRIFRPLSVSCTMPTSSIWGKRPKVAVSGDADSLHYDRTDSALTLVDTHVRISHVGSDT